MPLIVEVWFLHLKTCIIKISFVAKTENLRPCSSLRDKHTHGRTHAQTHAFYYIYALCYSSRVKNHCLFQPCLGLCHTLHSQANVMEIFRSCQHRGRHGIIFGWAKHLFPLFPTLPNTYPPLLTPPSHFNTGIRGITPEKF
jgi:hypothetical protein